MSTEIVTGSEIIVVDDGSRDGSVSIIRDYCQKHPNIHFYQHEDGVNRGLPASTRLGIEKASGKYIAFCESDDWWDNHHAEELLSFLAEHPESKMVFNHIEVINGVQTDKWCRYAKECNAFLADNQGQNIFMALDRNYMLTFSAACISKDLLLSCDFNAYHLQYIDFWLWRQLCLRYPVNYINNAVTWWRRHPESYDNRSNIEDTTDFLLASNGLLKEQVQFSFADRFHVSKFRLFHHSRWKIIRYEMARIYRASLMQ